MIKRSDKHRRKRKPPEGSSRAKGDVVEKIVAAIHEHPDVQVETNVYLYTQDGESSREIDVLLSSQVVGYPIHFAFECKNETEKIGVGKIDEFIGKLDDVGIPTHQGVFVSASSYTKGAIRRAQQNGITALLLKETTEKLPNLMKYAFQSIIFLLANIIYIKIINNLDGPASWRDILFFRDQNGKDCGSVMDLVWLKWQSGEISMELGLHQINVNLPEGWYQIVNGEIAEVSEIRVSVQISAHLVSFPGIVSQHELLQASDMKIDKWQINAKFSTPTGTYPVATCLTEYDLQQTISPSVGIRVIVGRFPLPRIRWRELYWPPSECAIQKINALAKTALEKEESLDWESLDFAEIEGTDLQTAWEAIAPNHPIANNFS